MKRLLLLPVLVLTACNPAPRCKASNECANQGVCSGGFCTDPVIQATDAGPGADGGATDAGLDAGRPDAGVPEDVDDPDASVIDAGEPLDSGLPDGGDGR